jgi:hypothetical protein
MRFGIEALIGGRQVHAGGFGNAQTAPFAVALTQNTSAMAAAPTRYRHPAPRGGTGFPPGCARLFSAQPASPRLAVDQAVRNQRPLTDDGSLLAMKP